MDEHEIDGRLLARFMAGTCTPEERAVVRAWKMEGEGRAEFLDDVRQIWDVSEVPGDQLRERLMNEKLDVDGDWKRLRQRIRAAEEADRRLDTVAMDARPNGHSASSPTATSRSSPRVRQFLRVAAVVVLLVVSAVFFNRYQSPPPETASGETMLQQIITEPGQRATVRLGDGTRVMLNVDSELRVPRSFDETARRVELDGEAYFEVAPDSDHPFVIRSEGAQVEVLGTKFGMRAYSAGEVRVVVEEGKVAMGPRSSEAAQQVKLGAGQMGKFAGQSRGIDILAVDTKNYLGWREGQLRFHDARLTDVVATLERWYGVAGTIRHDSLRDLRLTANLRSQSLEDVLEVISVSLNIDYTLQSGEVTFTVPPRDGRDPSQIM